MDSGWLKVLDIRGPRAFVALVVCAGFSFGAEHKILSFAEAPKWVILTANCGCLLFGGLVVVWFCELLARPIKRAQNRAARERALKSAISTLSAEEWAVVAGIVQRRQNSATATISDPVFHSLTAKGLLVQRSGTGNILHWVFLMPDDVFELVDQELSRSFD